MTEQERILARGVVSEIFKATGVVPRAYNVWPAFFGYVLATSVLAAVISLVIVHI